MVDQLTEKSFKRNVAYKFRIGNIIGGKVVMEGERISHIDIDGKRVVRVNVIANIVDKYIQEGEKKFGSITLDDATGQIKLKVFGEDIGKFNSLEQGDTLLVIGLLRSWNDELYITPEIIKKKDPAFLLVRKLEVERDEPKILDKKEVAELKDKILGMIKQEEDKGGIDVDKIILELKENPNVVNAEIKKLLEDGAAYEPRPGKLRWLGQ
ncbi:OB-fold nucleic acid binding domain-containing protein [Candidatus Pacearchaeota archaeon]|nr:OB-fold nucleic acid binding domain-containing protein [Candidatus Pacearchaeota archaeon]